MIKVKKIGDSTIIGINIDGVRYFVVSNPDMNELETLPLMIGSIFSVEAVDLQSNVTKLYHNIIMTKIKKILSENGYLMTMDEVYYKRCMLCGTNFTESDVEEGKNVKICCKRSMYILPTWLKFQQVYIKDPIYFKEK